MIELELSKVQVNELGKNHASIIIGPLPAGYGVTLGNALRRVLLSSLDGAAITGVKIAGVTHEFSTIKGVKDNVIDIILNLKLIRFLSHSDEPITLKLEANKAGEVFAKDFASNADLELVTPDVYITSIESGANFSMEVVVEKGIGYSPVANREKKKNKDAELIQIDTFFSPVRKVRYESKNTRVGSQTNLDELEIEIITDGSVSPHDALAKAGGILRNYFSLLDPQLLTPEKTAEAILEAQVMKTKKKIGETQRDAYTPIEVLHMSPRTLNALINNGVTCVEKLVQLSESQLSNFKGFGARALMEVKEAFVKNGLEFTNEK